MEDVASTPTGCWWSLADGTFELRSTTYLADKVKKPSAPAVFKAIHVLAIDCNRTLDNLGRRLVPLREFLAANPTEEYFITNRACPVGGEVIRNVITVAKRVVAKGADAVFDRTWARFKAGDAEYRDLRLKYIPALCNAPWVLSSAINLLGGQRPVIMGKGYLTQFSSVGANYVEFSVDISSSTIARNIAGSILGYCASLDINEAFVVESKEEDELPERMLYQVQFRKVDTALAARELREEDYEEEAPPPPPPKPSSLGA